MQEMTGDWVYPENIVVMTTHGAKSGMMHIGVHEGVGMVRPVIEDQWYVIDSPFLWNDSHDLWDDIDQWYNSGDRPRDEDGRVIPFPVH